MLKLAGACFLVAGCAGFGWCICRDMEKRVGQLQLMIRAFSMLASEVGYSKVTLPEGLRRIGAKTGGRLGETLAGIGQKVCADTGVTLKEAWGQEMGAFLGETCLNSREKELLLTFPDYTGFVDGRMQLLALEQFETELQEQKKEAQSDVHNRRKAILSVSMAGGLRVAILLI